MRDIYWMDVFFGFHKAHESERSFFAFMLDSIINISDLFIQRFFPSLLLPLFFLQVLCDRLSLQSNSFLK